jgi:hypothetical protein
MSLLGNPAVYTDSSGNKYPATIAVDHGNNVVDLIAFHPGSLFLSPSLATARSVSRDDTGSNGTWAPASLAY